MRSRLAAGGNQQRLLSARSLLRDLVVLIWKGSAFSGKTNMLAGMRHRLTFT